MPELSVCFHDDKRRDRHVEGSQASCFFFAKACEYGLCLVISGTLEAARATNLAAIFLAAAFRTHICDDTAVDVSSTVTTLSHSRGYVIAHNQEALR